jgi:hypothetical protein
MPEKVEVEISVAGIEPCQGTGRLVALAVVEVTIGGVCLAFQGVQVRERGGKYLCQAPAFRHPKSGTWLPCLIAPVELTDAIGGLVVAQMEQPPIREVAA